ncbi:protein GDAP2 homolog [Patella vulgata]|uniref:protein GDAP2 homolog n=1 Tax=Patella vulgata TaxID=6465 RepID=UPI0021800EF3|nr:protein GDAP2 homolog [Patella vulgata]
MDPLGARDDLIDIDSLTRWNLTQLPEYVPREKEDEDKKSVFPWRNDLNGKICLWSGDLTRLNTHAVVHTTNEKLNDRGTDSDNLFLKAGPELYKEIRADIKVIKTGEAKLTKGHGLPARFIIHTVGPRFNVKYLTAAESALFSCYRNTLQLAREQSIRTIGLSCIHTVKRGYPPDSGSHIACRTIRRFLEKFGDSFDTIVLVCNQENLDAYKNILPLYFPRNSKEEEYALDNLPEDVGNENGEPVVAERQIRILDKPAFAAYKAVHVGQDDFEETIDLNSQFCTSTALDVGHHPFASMEEDPDKTKKGTIYGKNNADVRRIESQRRYERLLKRAKTDDLTDIAGTRFLYRAGSDRFNRPVVVFVGKNFPATSINLEKALLYLIRVMDPIADSDFIVVYYHTLTTNQNYIPMAYLKMAYNVLDYKYRKHLRSFYIVHPTWWTKVATWFFTTFTASDIKDKLHIIKGVQYLYSSITPDQLDVPTFVLDYDTRLNGPRYAIPSEAPEAL